MKAVHSGYDALSPEHRILYDAVIIPALTRWIEELRRIATMNSAPD